MHISTIKITSKKVLGNKVDFLAIEITLKKVRGNNVEFRPENFQRNGKKELTLMQYKTKSLIK